MTAPDRPVLVVDNFDSFVYNLVQYLGQLGVRCIVRRNDAVSVDELADLDVAGVLLSPGPGTPSDAGVTVPMVTAAARTIGTVTPASAGVPGPGDSNTPATSRSASSSTVTASLRRTTQRTPSWPRYWTRL